MENTPYIVGPSKSGVYAWINLVNGKVYVGSSRNIPKRRAEHLRFLRNGNHHSPHLQAAWDSYGRDAFAFEVLEPVEDPIWLEARETTWMLRLQAFHKECGYNIARDGWTGAACEPTERRQQAWKLNGEKKRGTKDSLEVRQHKQEGCRDNKFPSRKGQKNSEQHRAALSKAWIRRKQRGDFYKFTPQDTAVGVSKAAAKNEQLWKDPEYRDSQSQKFRDSWTEERRIEQAERARLQMLKRWEKREAPNLIIKE